MRAPDVIPAAERAGSHADELRTLDGVIARLQCVAAALIDDHPPRSAPPVIYGPHIDAPVWPWHLAGWLLGGGIAVLFVLAWLGS